MAENGQPPLPPQPPAAPVAPAAQAGASTPAEPRPTQEVCRKYVWGTCNKLTNCRFRHEHKFEEMVEILKFCHNFQNKGVCDFDRCSYLHTTTQEETLFKTEGIIPRVLQERYAVKAGTVATAAVAAQPPGFSYPMMPHAEGMQGAEGMLLPPPPPPPASAPPPPPPAAAPPARAPHTTANNVHLFNPPPAYTYPSPAPPNVATTIAVFDASRPPPNFPPCENIVTRTKRRCSGDPDGAGPRKTAKTSPNRLCEQCNLRRIRSAEMERYIQQMIVQEADLSLEYRKKKEQFLQKKRILLSLINPEHQRTIEEYIEGVPSVQPPDVIQYHQQLARQLNTNTHANTKLMIMQLMEMLLNKTFEEASLPSAPPIFRGVEESPALPSFIRQSLAQRPLPAEGTSPVGELLSTFNRLLANRQAAPETNNIASMLAMLQNESSRNEPPPPRPGGFARGGYPDVAGPSAAVAVRPPAPPYHYYPEAGPSHAAPPMRQPVQRYSYQEAGPSQAAAAPAPPAPHAPPPAAVPFSFHVPPPPPPAPRAYAPYAPHHAVMGSRERH